MQRTALRCTSECSTQPRPWQALATLIAVLQHVLKQYLRSQCCGSRSTAQLCSRAATLAKCSCRLCRSRPHCGKLLRKVLQQDSERQAASGCRRRNVQMAALLVCLRTMELS